MGKLLISTILAGLLASSMMANEFVDYKALTTKLKAENKKNGLFATADDVKKALASKDWQVVDVRTIEEWAGAHIEGSSRVGRQAPEGMIANLVLDDNDKLVKDKLIVVCNSAARASIEAETFRKMGFKKVMVYDIYSWIDECNPVVTNYTVKKDKSGTGLKFGHYYAEHCKK